MKMKDRKSLYIVEEIIIPLWRAHSNDLARGTTLLILTQNNLPKWEPHVQTGYIISM